MTRDLWSAVVCLFFYVGLCLNLSFIPRGGQKICNRNITTFIKIFYVPKKVFRDVFDYFKLKLNTVFARFYFYYLIDQVPKVFPFHWKEVALKFDVNG